MPDASRSTAAGSGPQSGVPSGADPDDVEFRTADTPDLQQRASVLYRAVFGYDDPALGVNPRLLTTLVRNGGSAVAAVDGSGEVVAFTYGVHATSGGRSYHYSQAAVVADAAQGRGLGRRLKEAQADVARASGVDTMRWSYDPLLTRNGHFNLDVLGGTGRWFVDDFYGTPATDRVVVEWDLRTRPATPTVESELVVSTRPADADGSRAVLRRGFHDALDAGLVAVSCSRLGASSAVYRFGRSPA